MSHHANIHPFGRGLSEGEEEEEEEDLTVEERERKMCYRKKRG
jgi:hypothetical protein